MADPTLSSFARHGENGRLIIRIFKRADGALVLTDPEVATGRADLRALEGVECMWLAAAATAGPPLVAEGADGDYLVLPDVEPDPEQHLPLDPVDAEVLLGPAAALGGFGRRTDDVVPLQPWSPELLQVTFEPDDPAFADVPVVEYDGGLTMLVRGELEESVLALVSEHLRGVDETGRYGVFHNEFGEFAVYSVGDSIEPHNDVRVGTVLDVAALVEGAESLVDAAARLRELAERMDTATRRGWTLAAPVSDGFVYPERSARPVA